jgi:hypothetical protein
MKEVDEEERLLRRFLLGLLDEDERERVEERFITDRDFKELALMVEDELVGDYLTGGLSETEEELFVKHLLSTPEQRRKVRIASALRNYVVSGAPPFPTGPGEPPGSGKDEANKGVFWLNRTVILTASLAMLLAVIFGAVWFAGVPRRGDQIAEVRRELEQLNRQPISNGSSGFFLSPLAARGGGATNTLPPSNDGAVIQLWLLLVKDEYPGYQVIFQKDGEAERFTLGGLRAETTPSGRAIPVRLPARLLRPGVYIFKLSGVATDGRVEEVGEYDFRTTP